MQISVLHSKIHRATVTEAQLDYEGSLGVDSALMQAAGLVPYQKVLVADVTNGTRHETYVVPAPANSGSICVMGAAAHLAKPGDLVIIMAFGLIDAEKAADHHPRIVLVNDKNRPKKTL